MMPTIEIMCAFSGGETSAFMAIKLKEKYGDSAVFVFANTGEENDETLIFADKVDKEFGLNLVWLETLINPEKGKGSGYNVVDFNSASRKGEPFERMIEKYGLPNPNKMVCTRELKTNPITKYRRDFYPGCQTAIGIRVDEIDRISPNRKKQNIVYPLVTDWPVNKNQINCFWRDHSYRLNLKHYEGNCKWCYKKSSKKLAWIMRENPEFFDFPERMEKLHSKTNWAELGKEGEITMFRGNRTVEDIRKMSLTATEPFDDAQNYQYNKDIFDEDMCGSESCEAF